MRNGYINLHLKLFAIITLFATGFYAQSAQNDFSTKRWTLVEINGKKISNSKAFIEFDQTGNRFAGNADCNRMFGEFTLSGANITFANVGTTKKFCAQAGLMKLETEFTRALGEAIRLRQKNGELEFYKGNRLILKFAGGNETGSGNNVSASGKLDDKKWILESIKNLPVGKLKEEPFIIFDKKKQSAGGNSSCNSFDGNYTTKNAKIKIIKILMTMRACAQDNRMQVEKEFLDGLQNTNRYEIKNGKLFLYQDANILLTFVGQNKT
jgi:heat shock protein HslJ